MPVNRLLVATSVVYAVVGLALLFAGDDIVGRASTGVPPIALWMAGLLGGAVVSLALLNWIQRHTMIGGIYGRPLLFTNLLFLSNCTFSALRLWRAHGDVVYGVTCVVSAILFAAFGRLLFTNPAGVGSGPQPT